MPPYPMTGWMVSGLCGMRPLTALSTKCPHRIEGTSGIISYWNWQKPEQRDGKPIPIPRAYRIASLTVALYWRRISQKPTILSLDTDITNGDGDTTELIDTIADDKAIDLDAWMDAKIWLLGCPIRLVQIASKRVKGITLTNKELQYLWYWRHKEQKTLIAA